jgi:hypothetical protein
MPAPFGSPFVDPRRRPAMPPPGMAPPGMGMGPPQPQAGPAAPMSPLGPLPTPGMGPPPVGPPGVPGMGPLGMGPPGMGQPVGPPPKPPADIPPSAAGGPMTPTIDGPISPLALAAIMGGPGGAQSMMGSPQGGLMMSTPGGLLAPNSSLDAVLEVLSKTPTNPEDEGMAVPGMGLPSVGLSNPGMTQQESFLLSLVNRVGNQRGQESLLQQIGPGVSPGPLDIDEATMNALMGVEGGGSGL